PVETIVDDHAFWRANQAVVRRLKLAGQGAGIRIDEPCTAIESMPALGIVGAVGLKVVELTCAETWNEDAPDVAPAIGIAIENNGLGRFAIVDLIVQQHAHGGG